MKQIKLLIAATAIGLLLGGCSPAKVDLPKEIASNESAYVIPLEGASKAKQGKFDSEKFLEEKKVATKRVYLSQRLISTGRFWYENKWVPTDRVLKVDRSPVTFVWEGKRGGKGVAKGQAGIAVESRDSIGFTVGINISAYIKEEDTSLFLYRYPAGNVTKVLKEIVKSKSTEVLSRKFASFDLEGTPAEKKGRKIIVPEVPGARQQKGAIVDEAKLELIAFFKESGVTITTFGLIGGLEYDDKEIQNSINDNFASELDIKNKANLRLAQEETNRKNIDMATAEKTAANEFAAAAVARTKQANVEIALMAAKTNLMFAEAAKIKAGKWDGGLPDSMMPANSGFIIDQSRK